MSINRWLRNKARLAVDSIFCSSSPGIQLVGNEDSGWVMMTTPQPLVIYCAGVGQGISFELELAKIAKKPVLVFDPSPTGVATMAKCDMRNLEFFPVGLAADTGVIEFSLPKDPGEGSYSLPQDGVDKISFECWSLDTIMKKNADSYIDLLKMDIEGFEYDIIDRFLDESIPVRQLCVEFHPWIRPNRTLKTITKLYKAGYRIIHKRRGDYTFLLKNSRSIKPQQQASAI